jgi:hypothetical protein
MHLIRSLGEFWNLNSHVYFNAMLFYPNGINAMLFYPNRKCFYVYNVYFNAMLFYPNRKCFYVYNVNGEVFPDFLVYFY